jgi:amino acid adenylation domain-containing protein
MDPSGQTYPHDALVPQLVAARAKASPNDAAIFANNQVVTYGELDGRANQIGHFLRSCGVRPDTLVVICMEQSVALIVAALGILKSGGAYVPLDPAYPPARLAFMLNDAQPAVLVTDQHLAKLLPTGKWRTVKLDVDMPQIARHSMAAVESDVSGENLAYVIYTSGSTGRPKGVQIAHDSLSNLVFWHQRVFDVRPTDRASLLSSPGFDAAVWELWPYLTAGASVHPPDGATHNEPEAIRNWLVKHGITIAFVPSPMADRMIALEWPRETALRVLLTGADTLHSYPPDTLPFTLVNNYGPTECTVVATSGTVSSSERPDVLPPIGQAISNVQIYILDERLEQVPAGIPGEIYIGGAGLARGYLNMPELTATKFIADPFHSKQNGRLYKTGDLARCLGDGQISFLGRVDEQIKVRGYRIEPNEIVKALNEHPTVLASAVGAREDTRGDKYLVGYVVASSGAQLTAAALQEFLSQRLPRYMVPSVFVRLESLLLTSTGKVDRASLPAPSAENTIPDSTYVAPHSVTEQRLVAILSTLLGIDHVGVNDNFFLLGGHSLLGAQLIAEVRDAFGVQLTLRSIFDSPTAAALSGEIEKSLSAKVNAMTPGEVQRALAQSLDQS